MIRRMSKSRETSSEDYYPNFDLSYKILLIGDLRVGKTSILNNLNNKVFTPTYKPTSNILNFGFDSFHKVDNTIVRLVTW
jgi:GTPase SAR1 family protein